MLSQQRDGCLSRDCVHYGLGCRLSRPRVNKHLEMVRLGALSSDSTRSKSLVWCLPLAAVQRLGSAHVSPDCICTEVLINCCRQRWIVSPKGIGGDVHLVKLELARLMHSASLAPILSRSAIRSSNVGSLHGADKRGAFGTGVDPLT